MPRWKRPALRARRILAPPRKSCAPTELNGAKTMRESITLHTLSDTTEASRLIRWLKQPGDPVKKADMLAEVETDKAIVDLEAFHDRYLLGPLAQVDADIPVGTVIGPISDSPQQAQAKQAGAPEEADNEKTAITPKEKKGGEEEGTEIKVRSPTSPAVRSVTEERPATHEIPSVPPPQAAAPASIGQQGSKASPYAQGLARELGIDLHQISAASDGVIHAPQVLSAALAGPAPNLDAGPAYRLEPLTSMHPPRTRRRRTT
jgi:pyruvate dehydrogenase E2 component (dihydrolipoamide acetyltransferase)